MNALEASGWLQLLLLLYWVFTFCDELLRELELRVTLTLTTILLLLLLLLLLLVYFSSSSSG